ncbi:hypothetical protein Hanom_Chr00s002969g01707371 [Helianthus anomalus]
MMKLGVDLDNNQGFGFRWLNSRIWKDEFEGFSERKCGYWMEDIGEGRVCV